MTYLYSGSDFFPDVLPALIYKKFNPNTKWVQCVFHLYPHWKKRPGNFFINFFGYYLQKISLFYIKRADIVININEEVKSELVKIGFESKKISIITPGIDIKKINNFVSTNLEKRNYEYEVIYMGRLNPSKGVQDLTKIWEEIRKINPKNIPRLAIIGGGSSSAIRRLESNIENSGMSSVISILGFLPQEEVYSIFSSAKVFILPSYEEGFGIVIAEAFAFGLPVVAWDLPIYENLFGPGVHRVCIGNVKRFAKKIDQLLNSININRDALKEFAQKYDWDKKAEYMRNLLILNNEIIE